MTVVADAKAMLDEDAREFGLATELDTIIADETNHRDELRQVLARWPCALIRFGGQIDYVV